MSACWGVQNRTDFLGFSALSTCAFSPSPPLLLSSVLADSVDSILAYFCSCSFQCLFLVNNHNWYIPCSQATLEHAFSEYFEPENHTCKREQTAPSSTDFSDGSQHSQYICPSFPFIQSISRVLTKVSNMAQCVVNKALPLIETVIYLWTSRWRC